MSSILMQHVVFFRGANNHCCDKTKLSLQVKVDLIELSEKGCSDFDLQAELERSFLSEPSSPGRTKTTKGFKLGKHKHETFITSR